MKPNVILYKNLPDDLKTHLAQHSTLTPLVPLGSISSPEVQSALSQTEGMIGVGKTIDPEMLDAAPKLRVISTISVGYDYFDVADLTKRGIFLMHTPDVLTDTTADMIFMLILCAARRATEMIELVRQGGWVKDIGNHYFGADVHGKKLGILGMGRIGYAVAKRAYAGFNMEILYYSRTVNQRAETDFKAHRCTLDHLLGDSDFVCVTLPLSDQTRKLIGRKQLGVMKPGAFIINGGRGPVIDETALIEALQNGVIRGAGLDVYEQEPLPLDSPLLSLPNVITLPHIGSATHETRHAMARCAVDNLLSALAGAPQSNCVNPDAAKYASARH